MAGHQIPAVSWVHPGLYVDRSPIDGTGVFTRVFLPAGTVVVRWGGIVLTTAEISDKAKPHTRVAIDEDTWLCGSPEDEYSIDDYMNHSCIANVWLQDKITLETKHDVTAATELTADYAIWLNDPSYVLKRRCNCRAATCRGIITGVDWQLPNVQIENHGHFSPFLNKRIELLRATAIL